MIRSIALISEHASPLATAGGIDAGGQNIYVAQIARELGRLGYSVDVFTRRDSDRLPEMVDYAPNVRVINVPAGPAKYRRQHNLPVKVARIFNTYGPRMHPNDGRVVSNFIVQALQGKPITVYGKGRQTRSFCYVSDLIDGVVKLMASDEDFTGPVNIGNPHECTVLELAERIIELCHSRSQIIFEPLPSDDPARRCPDITLARAMLKWEPTVPLADGLARTIEYFDQLLRNRGQVRNFSVSQARA